jgi:hypothetical protein
MSYQEIANKIEEPLSNVKIKLLRAKNYWQKLFEINANTSSLAYNPKPNSYPFLIKLFYRKNNLPFRY